MHVGGPGISGRAVACGLAVAIATGMVGCKSVSEKYIALEVWKYERLFGHLPPGFVPPGAAQQAAPGPRICGQGGPCQNNCGGGAEGCDQCAGGEAVHSLPGGAPAGGIPPGATAPAGPGGSPGPLPGQPASPFRPTVSKPVVISDEVVIP